MPDDAVRHINVADASGKVYCHKGGAISEIDGLHLAGMCWDCPLLAGLAKGYGVECSYTDPNVGPNMDEITFSDPQDAMSAAPARPTNMDTIASDDGIECRDLRAKLSPDQDQQDQMDQPDNETTPPTREQAQQGEPVPPVAQVQASTAADTNMVVKAALQELEKIMNG